MGVALENGDAGAARAVFQPVCLALLCGAQGAVMAQMAHGCMRRRRHGRGQGGGEDKARAVAAHRVADHVACRDIAAAGAERLAERALDDVDPAVEAAHLRDAAALGAIHADGMDLVEIGQRVILPGQRRDLGNRAGVAIHRIDGFKDDDLRPVIRLGGQQLLEMGHVIVPEDRLFGARQLDARDDRGMVHLVGQDQHVRKLRHKGRQAGLVGDIAAGKGQGAFLAVKGGQLVLERDQSVAGAGDVAGAAGTGAARRCRRAHRRDHVRMLAHAQIIVGTPDGDLLRRAIVVTQGNRMTADDPLELDEMPIAVLGFQPVQLRTEMRGIVTVECHACC